MYFCNVECIDEFRVYQLWKCQCRKKRQLHSTQRKTLPNLTWSQGWKITSGKYGYMYVVHPIMIVTHYCLITVSTVTWSSHLPYAAKMGHSQGWLFNRGSTVCSCSSNNDCCPLSPYNSKHFHLITVSSHLSYAAKLGHSQGGCLIEVQLYVVVHPIMIVAHCHLITVSTVTL